MVQVSVEKMRKDSSSILDTSIVWNTVMEDLSERITKDVSQLSCSEHPDHISVITIKMDRNDQLEFDKKFCCQEFSDTIRLNVEH